MPQGTLNPETEQKIGELYGRVGKQIEDGAFKDALDEIFEFIRSANKFFDSEQPWITRTTDEVKCQDTLYQCVQIIANLAVLLAPFLPFSSEKVSKWLSIELNWAQKSVPAGFKLPETEILFQRIDKKVIETESEKLKAIL